MLRVIPIVVAVLFCFVVATQAQEPVGATNGRIEAGSSLEEVELQALTEAEYSGPPGSVEATSFMPILPPEDEPEEEESTPADDDVWIDGNGDGDYDDPDIDGIDDDGDGEIDSYVEEGEEEDPDTYYEDPDIYSHGEKIEEESAEDQTNPFDDWEPSFDPEDDCLDPDGAEDPGAYDYHEDDFALDPHEDTSCPFCSEGDACSHKEEEFDPSDDCTAPEDAEDPGAYDYNEEDFSVDPDEYDPDAPIDC